VSGVLILLWMLLAAIAFLGLIGVTIMGFGFFISLFVNLLLLPLRIVLWVLRGLFGIL